MEDLPNATVISLVDCSSETVDLVSDNLAFTVTQDSESGSCAYIIHLPVGTDPSLLSATVTNILEDIKPIEIKPEQLLHPEEIPNSDLANLLADSSSGTFITLSGTEEVITETVTQSDCPVEIVENVDTTQVDTHEANKGEPSAIMDTSEKVKIETNPPSAVESTKTLLGTAKGKKAESTAVSKKFGPVQKPVSTPTDGIKKPSQPGPATSSVKSSVRTYGKPKTYGSPKEVKEAPESRSSATAVPNPPQSESEQNIIRLSDVQVSQPNFISLKRRKRRLIIDAQKQIPIGEFKRQLVNTEDIVLDKRDMAPPSKRAMKFLEGGSVGKIFCTPGIPTPGISPDEQGHGQGALSSSEFSLMREKALSASRSAKGAVSKLSFRGVRKAPAIKQYSSSIKQKSAKSTVSSAHVSEPTKSTACPPSASLTCKAKHNPHPVVVELSEKSEPDMGDDSHVTQTHEDLVKVEEVVTGDLTTVDGHEVKVEEVYELIVPGSGLEFLEPKEESAE